VCREEIPYLQELRSIYNESELEIVMISDEPVETIAAFAEQQELPFTFLKLKSKSADLEIHKIPTAYLVKDGKELDNEVGLYDWTSEEGRKRIALYLEE
jgi:thiol-disulfide isomerase/thioredoxin